MRMHETSSPALSDANPSGMTAMQLERWMTPKSPELWFFAGVTS